MTPSTNSHANARGRATTRAIETAAVRLALQHGAAALTVDQICAEAGIKQRTFFNHFATKEDALLGSALPGIDEPRVREYLSDPRVPVLTGALRLVAVPTDAADDLGAARLRLLAATPALAERQAARLIPVAEEVRAIIRLKLAALGPNETPERLDASAALITRIASSLLLQPRLPGDNNPPLEELRWIWEQLI